MRGLMAESPFGSPVSSESSRASWCTCSRAPVRSLCSMSILFFFPFCIDFVYLRNLVRISAVFLCWVFALSHTLVQLSCALSLLELSGRAYWPVSLLCTLLGSWSLPDTRNFLCENGAALDKQSVHICRGSAWIHEHLPCLLAASP